VAGPDRELGQLLVPAARRRPQRACGPLERGLEIDRLRALAIGAGRDLDAQVRGLAERHGARGHAAALLRRGRDLGRGRAQLGHQLAQDLADLVVEAYHARAPASRGSQLVVTMVAGCAKNR
jgi:hypothetical protein